MNVAMTENNSTDDTARTTIEVDRKVWRQVRAEAVGEGKNISEKLEEILREHFEEDDA